MIKKVLTGSIVAIFVTLLGLNKIKSNKIEKLEDKVVYYSDLNEKLTTYMFVMTDKMKQDSLNHLEQIKSIQSTIAQMHNKGKLIEKENAQLRRGVRYDLLTIRVRRNGSVIDSVYKENYK